MQGGENYYSMIFLFFEILFLILLENFILTRCTTKLVLKQHLYKNIDTNK
jgi:hypothetical protein